MPVAIAFRISALAAALALAPQATHSETLDAMAYGPVPAEQPAGAGDSGLTSSGNPFNALRALLSREPSQASVTVMSTQSTGSPDNAIQTAAPAAPKPPRATSSARPGLFTAPNSPFAALSALSTRPASEPVIADAPADVPPPPDVVVAAPPPAPTRVAIRIPVSPRVTPPPADRGLVMADMPVAPGRPGLLTSGSNPLADLRAGLGRRPVPKLVAVVRAAPPLLPAPGYDAAYRLDAGDRLRIVIYGQEGLTNGYVVGATGAVVMPLIGPVQARGLTPGELAGTITARLRNGFIREPSVAVEIDAYRPFFILGEVAAPGQYPFVPNMTVESAVAIAGGFSPRAKRSAVTLTHTDINGTIRAVVPPIAPVNPGDTILVGERWF